MQQADSVLYDNLANDALLDLAPAHAERIYVGKKKSAHAFTQEEICAMLIERARRGWNVVRLKGGDPFIFGRGGEEAEALADAGIPFEIVPGVTTPLGIAAYTGVPLTHREHTSAVTLRHRPRRGRHRLEQRRHVGNAGHLHGPHHFSANRARADRSAAARADTPAMAVRWATRPDQETLVGTLATLPGLIERHQMKPPATIIVGEVVRLREKLNWYRAPAALRPAHRDHARQRAGRRAVVEADARWAPRRSRCPPSRSAPPPTTLRSTAPSRTSASYDWLIFTSVNGVRFFLDRLDRSAADLRALRARICAIGPATRAAIEALHLKVDLMGKEYVAEGLLEAFRDHDLRWQARPAAARGGSARSGARGIGAARRDGGCGGSLPHRHSRIGGGSRA